MGWHTAAQTAARHAQVRPIASTIPRRLHPQVDSQDPCQGASRPVAHDVHQDSWEQTDTTARHCLYRILRQSSQNSAGHWQDLRFRVTQYTQSRDVQTHQLFGILYASNISPDSGHPHPYSSIELEQLHPSPGTSAASAHICGSPAPMSRSIQIHRAAWDQMCAAGSDHHPSTAKYTPWERGHFVVVHPLPVLQTTAPTRSSTNLPKKALAHHGGTVASWLSS